MNSETQFENALPGNWLRRRPVLLWSGIATLLLVWNGAAATFASPLVLLHRYDCAQYQLLARNRLCGHYEVGDGFHSVHQEGSHPMWRPGLVWIEEGLARCLGSVHQGAAAASALGTTLLELALLGLAWCSFGKKTVVCVLIGLAMPAVGFPFLVLAVGQGAEVWAAAAIVFGLALLVKALQDSRACPSETAMNEHAVSGRRPIRGTLLCGLVAGTVAALSEWFRTGNAMLFAIPCAVYTLAALHEQTRRQGDKETRRQDGLRPSCSPCLLVSLSPCLLVPAVALFAWVVMAAAADRAVPSSVNKTVANLWDCRANVGGPFVVDEHPDGTRLVHWMLGYSLVPASGTNFPVRPPKSETYFDYAVRSSRSRSTLDYCREHFGEIGCAYIQHLEEAVTRRFWGIRQIVGELVLLLFGVQLLLCIGKGSNSSTPGKSSPFSEGSVTHTLALAGAALGHYLGPVVLIASDAPTHYILVALPLFVLVAARGAVRLAELVGRVWQHLRPEQTFTGSDRDTLDIPWPFTAAIAAVLLGLSMFSYRPALERLKELQQLSSEQQAAVNALRLDGKKVACRNMSWFVDQEVETFLLPYATVPELENYVRDYSIDGILIWEEEPTPFFRATPYGALAAFERALQKSSLFGPPRASGTLRWYPVCATATTKE
jgi:hypothetical protein